MLKIAIVDDEYAVAAQTERRMAEICKELMLEVQIELFGSGEEAIRFMKKTSGYHIVFLDIEMGDCSGIDVSRYIRNILQDEAVQLVYVTGKSGYDRQLFEFRPFGFIEKPATTEKMREVLAKYVRIFGEKQEMFEYKAGHGTYFVRVSDILYFESVGRKVRIKTSSGEVFFYGTIQQVWEQMKDRGFFVPHKSYLVNYRCIKSFHPDCLYIVNDERIPIAKGKRQEVARLQLRMEEE